MFHTSSQKSLFDQVAELTHDVLDVTDDEVVVGNAVESIIRNQVGGEEHTLSSLINDQAQPETGGAAAQLLGQFDGEWRKSYIEEQLFFPHRDYGIQHTLTKQAPLLKSKYPLHAMNKEQISTYNRASDFTMVEGAIFPIHTFTYQIYMLSITGTHFNPSYADLLALQVLASAASEAIKRIRGEKKTILEYGLTKRELQILELLCCDPKRHTNAVIAEILNIGSRQVEKHLTSTYAKLGGVKRSGAIELAKAKHIHIYGRNPASNIM